MVLFDVHCHLDLFENADEIVKRAESAGVRININNGVDVESNRKTLELSRKFKSVHAALGLHPEFIEKFSGKLIDSEIEFIRKNKDTIVAVGEVGLDFHWVKDEKSRAKQEEMFRSFINLSNELNKPLIIHSRDAEKEVVNILKNAEHENFIMHSFGGRLNLLNELLNEGAYFSVPPVIIRSSHFQELVKRVPLSNLLTETDSPFLSPFKDKKNEPANVKLTVEKIAEIKGLTFEEVKNNLFMNYLKLFSQ